MKKRADTIIFVLLFGGLVAVTALILTGQSHEGSPFELFPRRTSYSAGPNGTKALFTTVEELGLRATRLHVSFAHLPKRGRLLFVISPLRPIAREEWRALKEWVAQGNYACIGLEDALLPEWMEAAFEGVGDGQGASFGVNTATPATPTGLTSGVREIRFKGVTRLTANADPPRPAKAKTKAKHDHQETGDASDECAPGGT